MLYGFIHREYIQLYCRRDLERRLEAEQEAAAEAAAAAGAEVTVPRRSFTEADIDEMANKMNYLPKEYLLFRLEISTLK